MQTQQYFDNYSAVGDLTVIAINVAIVVLLCVSYVKKNRNSALFLNILLYLSLAALVNVICHTVYTTVYNGDYTLVYILRILYHVFLFSTLLIYVVYIVSFLELGRVSKRLIMFASTAVYVMVIALDILTTANGTGFRLDENGKQIKTINMFLVGDILFVSIITFVLAKYGKKLFKRVMNGFYGTIIISFLILFMQGSHGQTSFTTVSFIFPTIAMLYLLHSNPYDVEMGVTNLESFEDTISYFSRSKTPFLYVSLYLPDFDHEGAVIPNDIKELMKELSLTLFKGVSSYQVSPGHMIFVAKRSINKDYKKKSANGVITITSLIDKLGYSYKIILGSSDDELSSRNCYLNFFENIHRRMSMNEVHISSDDDVKAHKEFEYIVKELADISKKRDLDDPRVLAFCQPVYNIKTNKYDSAETLMRLDLKECGLVAPYKFIPVAEDLGFINALTTIIISKACREIKALEEEGYDFKRISVNVSMLDMKNSTFTEDVMKIIDGSGIIEKKIAFEVTESQSEFDLNLVKTRIAELKEKGIKFYLDDFGTGFSNMERLLELPFDIIKFDRSLVIASNSDERSEKMVGKLASMFAELDYRVLYEGVEDEDDELRCRKMSASYLQGFKYSKPIPIYDLRKFFDFKEGHDKAKLG